MFLICINNLEVSAVKKRANNDLVLNIWPPSSRKVRIALSAPTNADFLAQLSRLRQLFMANLVKLIV